MKQEMMLVAGQKEIAKNIFELTLKGELVKQMETSKLGRSIVVSLH